MEANNKQDPGLLLVGGMAGLLADIADNKAVLEADRQQPLESASQHSYTDKVHVFADPRYSSLCKDTVG